MYLALSFASLQFHGLKNPDYICEMGKFNLTWEVCRNIEIERVGEVSSLI